jgi:hypothetical protein
LEFILALAAAFSAAFLASNIRLAYNSSCSCAESIITILAVVASGAF